MNPKQPNHRKSEESYNKQIRVCIKTKKSSQFTWKQPLKHLTPPLKCIKKMTSLPKIKSRPFSKRLILKWQINIGSQQGWLDKTEKNNLCSIKKPIITFLRSKWKRVNVLNKTVKNGYCPQSVIFPRPRSWRNIRKKVTYQLWIDRKRELILDKFYVNEKKVSCYFNKNLNNNFYFIS